MNLEELKELRSDAVQYAAQALSPSNREWYERVVSALDQKDAEIAKLRAAIQTYLTPDRTKTLSEKLEGLHCALEQLGEDANG